MDIAYRETALYIAICIYYALLAATAHFTAATTPASTITPSISSTSTSGTTAATILKFYGLHSLLLPCVLRRLSRLFRCSAAGPKCQFQSYEERYAQVCQSPAPWASVSLVVLGPYNKRPCFLVSRSSSISSILSLATSSHSHTPYSSQASSTR